MFPVNNYHPSPISYSTHSCIKLAFELDPYCDKNIGFLFVEFAGDYLFNANISQDIRPEGGSEWSDFVKSFVDEPASVQFIRTLSNYFFNTFKAVKQEPVDYKFEVGTTVIKSESDVGSALITLANALPAEEDNTLKFCQTNQKSSTGMSGERSTLPELADTPCSDESEVNQSKTCIFKNCDKQAYFNQIGAIKGLYCSKHKLPGMKDVKNKKCKFEGCEKQPSFNFPLQSKGDYCYTHKLSGMVDVHSKRCEHPICCKRAYFNLEGEVKARYCSEHKMDGMVGVQSRRCHQKSCTRMPYYNYAGKGAGLYCGEHKLEGMIHVKKSSGGSSETFPLNNQLTFRRF